MPREIVATNKSPRKWEWIKIQDFSPGIISYSNFALPSGPVPGRLGAAQPSTHHCISLPGGGLGPLPTVAATYSAPNSAFTPGGTNFITGAEVSTAVGDELLWASEFCDGVTRTVNIVATAPSGAWNRIIETITEASSNVTQTSPFTAALTMVNATTPANTGNVCAVLAVSPLSGTSAPQPKLYIYPDPTSPGTTAVPKDYSSSLPAAGIAPGGIAVVFGHQNRIVWLDSAANLWTGATQSLSQPFERFYYTDPPNSVPGYVGGVSSLAQNEMFIQEFPFGSGAWGSMNAGELFIVKQYGGGYIISGDLNNPIVTWLPGVEPTYGTACQATSSPIGFVYLSGNNGAWLWDGGSKSRKISTQLEDNFFAASTAPPNLGQLNCQAIAWGDWIFTSNNWVFDTKTGGWWRLDTQAIPFVWFGLGSGGLYAFPGHLSVANGPIAYLFNRTTLANSYTWVSYPLPPTTDPERSVTIRRLVVRVQGNGTIRPTFTGAGGSTGATTPGTATFNSTQPVRLVFDVGEIAAHDIYLTIQSTGAGGGAAPVIYSLDIAYEEETILNAT